MKKYVLERKDDEIIIYEDYDSFLVRIGSFRIKEKYLSIVFSDEIKGLYEILKNMRRVISSGGRVYVRE